MGALNAYLANANIDEVSNLRNATVLCNPHWEIHAGLSLSNVFTLRVYFALTTVMS